MFSTAQNTQRDSQSYVEKRRGREEREVTRERKGRVKRGESSQASNHTLPGAVMGGPACDEVMKKIPGRQGRPGPHP